MEIYEPSDDSFFFEDFLRDFFSGLGNKDISYLDMGCGSGILGNVAKECGINNILCSDINADAVDFVEGEGLNVVESDLFEKVNGTFDVITFNAPYLPDDNREPDDSKVITTGGKNGDEISVEFVKQAKKHLNENGRIFLLVSSLTPLDELKKYDYKIVKRKKIFFEELFILEIS